MAKFNKSFDEWFQQSMADMKPNKGKRVIQPVDTTHWDSTPPDAQRAIIQKALSFEFTHYGEKT